MTVKVLKPFTNPVPFVPTPKRPQCEADVQLNGLHDTEWRQDMHKKKIRSYGQGRFQQCTRMAVVEINGVPMCRIHGGNKVLDLYVSGEIVDRPKLPQGSDHPGECECADCWQQLEGTGPGIV